MTLTSFLAARFVPDTEVVQHQLAQQELEGSTAVSYEEYLRRLTQAVDTEVRFRWQSQHSVGNLLARTPSKGCPNSSISQEKQVLAW